MSTPSREKRTEGAIGWSDSSTRNRCGRIRADTGAPPAGLDNVTPGGAMRAPLYRSTLQHLYQRNSFSSERQRSEAQSRPSIDSPDDQLWAATIHILGAIGQMGGGNGVVVYRPGLEAILDGANNRVPRATALE